jgi:DNA gyrase subunit A
MAKRTTKKALKPVRPQLGDGVEILNAGSVLEDPITRTLETNYMPYAMSVIVSRALPEIDGFKPAHRKLLYTMYGMGLLKGARTKSANIVGSTMHLNPHGDAAIYDTMVRMGRGNESLLVPYVDSKGNFGKAYSRDMSCAAARYTEAKLEGGRRSISSPTTTAPPPSRPFCRSRSPPSWPTTHWASPSAWPATSARSIWWSCAAPPSP